MLEHNFARAIEACAPGKRVTVMFASGKSLTLPIVPPTPEPEPPHPVAVLSQQLLERDAETRASMEAVSAALEGLSTELANVGREIVGTLHLPVVPTKYDKEGRMIEARRKERSQ